MNIKEQFRQYHPAFRVLILMLPVALTIYLHDFIFGQPTGLKELLRDYYQNSLYHPKEVINFVIWAPIWEELVYRGPAYLVLLFTLLLLKKYPERKFLKTGGHALFILIALIPSYFWAIQHHYPITIFCYGLLWIWLMFQTRSIIYPIVFHSSMNAFAFLYIWFGAHSVYK